MENLKKYPKYKPSGVEWIGEIPDEWEVERLKIFLESEQNGVWGEEGNGDENDKICIRVADFDREFDNLNKTENTIRNIKPQDFYKRKLLYGDLLIEKSGGGELTPVGRVGFFDWDNVEAVCANFVARLRLKEQNDSRYFFFLFKMLYKNRLNLKSIKQTTGIQNLDTYNYFFEKIATPKTKHEQTAIANYLDDKTAKIDTLIEKKKKLIELLKEERMAVINQAVTKGLNHDSSDLSDYLDSKNHSNYNNQKNHSADRRRMKDSGIDWLGEIPEHWEVKKLKYVAKLRDELIDGSGFKIAVENIESGTGKLVDMEEDKNYQGKLSAFVNGDTIFNKLRPYLHKVYYAEQDGGLFGELLIIYSLGELLPKFLFYKLFSKIFIDIVDGSTQGTKMPRANWNDFISLLTISFPKDKDEQIQIVQHIETETKRIDGTISKIEKEIELLAEYRMALISEVVTGKIKV